MLHLFFWKEMQMNVIYNLESFQILKNSTLPLFLGHEWGNNEKLKNSHHKSLMLDMGLSLFNRNLRLAE